MSRLAPLWVALGALATVLGCAQGTITPPGSSDGVGGTGSASSATGGGSPTTTATGTGGSADGGGGQGSASTGGGGAGGGTTSGTGGATASGTGGMGTGGSASGVGGSGGEMPHPCGDGVIGAGEECDGANLGGKTCVAVGFAGGTLTCNGQCKLDTSKCDACHNGMIQPALGEDCDFDALDQPLILASCQSLGFMSSANPGCDPNCHYDVTPCLCGNALIEGMEHCDGANLGGKTCVGQGFGGGELSCSPVCKFDTSGCTTCGNGMIEAGEECDGADLGGKTCVTQGFNGGALSCDAACKLVTSGCTSCGNGMIEAGEECDGANLGGKTCVTQGFTAGMLSCTPMCKLSSAGCTKCGNSVLEPGEACDDGNVSAGDGCSALCQLEAMVCDPDGNYAIIMGGPIAYSCCSGLVSVNVSSFLFTANGANIFSSPSNPATMTGAATTCPAGNFNNAASKPGGCTETYSLSGSFTGPNTWSGVYTLGFSGSDCDCFGGLFGAPCINQVYPITAMR